MGFGGIIFNFLGAVVRWVYGTIRRTISNKPKYTFSEYVYGPKNSDGWFDTNGHNFVNRIIGIISMVLMCWLIIRFGI